jgi:hypothetical protein
LYRISNDGLQVRRTFRDSRGLELLRKLDFFLWERHLSAMIKANSLSQSSLPIEWRCAPSPAFYEAIHLDSIPRLTVEAIIESLSLI